jgi:hypothetical protein
VTPTLSYQSCAGLSHWDAVVGGRLSWMKAEQNGVVLQRDDMWYNPGGDLNAVSHDRVGTTADHTECYGYDDRGRLKTAFTNATVAPTADCGVVASPTVGPSPYNQSNIYAANVAAGTTNGSC